MAANNGLELRRFDLGMSLAHRARASSFVLNTYMLRALLLFAQLALTHINTNTWCIKRRANYALVNARMLRSRLNLAFNVNDVHTFCAKSKSNSQPQLHHINSHTKPLCCAYCVYSIIFFILGRAVLKCGIRVMLIV